MKKNGKKCAVLISVILFTIAAFAEEYSAIFQPAPNTSDAASNGVWVVTCPSNAKKRLTTAKMYYSCFSPDGKKIAYVQGSDLHIMNNDGTDDKVVLSSSGKDWGWGAPHHGGGNDWNWPMWTTNGIFWGANDRFHRYIPETDTYSVLPLKPSMLGTDCGNADFKFMGRYHSSVDGLRVWTKKGFDPAGVDSLYCGVRGYSRGGHAYIHYSADFSSWDVLWNSEWGHGDGMTADGYLALVQLGAHRNRGFTRQTGKTLKKLGQSDLASGAYDTKGGYYNYKPPYPDGYQSRTVATCINNNDIMAGQWHNPDGGQTHFWFENWRTWQKLGEFAQPASAANIVQMWEGPLPNPHDNSAYIKLDKAELRFTYDGQTNPSNQQITAANAGAGTLTTLTAEKNSASTDWFSVTVDGNGGNSQTITVSIDGTKLTADQMEAKVTVKGGGAANETSFNVIAYKGSALQSPTSLLVEAAGDSLLDAKLTWTDNADGEDGYIIERKKGDGAWEEVQKTAADATTWTDIHLAMDSYAYRVKAFKNTPAAESDYSSEFKIDIVGKNWIRVTNPVAGQQVKTGSEITITWTQNNITQVYIEVSYDGGLTWETITPDGGILKGTERWEKWPWTAPTTEHQDAIIKVQEYNEEPFGVSGSFIITDNPAGVAVKPAAQSGRMFQVFTSAKKGASVKVLKRSHYSITLLTSSGKAVIKKSGEGPGYIDMNTKILPSGLYLLKCMLGSEKYTLRIAVL